MQYINIPHATSNYSGIYTCAVFLHASPDVYLMTENVKQNLFVYTPPTVTSMRRLTQKERKMFNYLVDSDVILCDVTSSICFNVTWLFNGMAINYGASNCSMGCHKSGTCVLEVAQSMQKGTYECVVNTAFANREAMENLSNSDSDLVLAGAVFSIAIATISVAVTLKYRLHLLNQSKKSTQPPDTARSELLIQAIL